MQKIAKCRACKKSNLKKFLSLGNIPLVNSFLKKEQLNSDEPKFPLDVYFCRDCGLVQLGEVVPPETMFKDYVYVSGTSETMKIHFKEFAEEAVKKLGKGLVIDIGGNDGTFLNAFKNLGMKTVNVEPATNIAEIARKNGIETVNDFWSIKIAKGIMKKYGRAKIVTGTNVFAHVNDWDEFIEAARTLLEDDGALIVEFPYLVDMIENTEFDTIYHEHLSYIAVRPLITLAKRLGMEVVDAVRTDVHGGSIRIYFMKAGKVSEKIKELIKLENEMGLDSFEIYEEFGERVEEIKKDLLALLKKLKSEGKKIVGYGAAAKGNVLMNYMGIGSEFLDYVVDKNPLKQNLLTPGTHLPVYSPEKLKEDKPDYLLILAWNFADEIMKQQADFKKSGGKFIIPIPNPRIV